jgi:hypothetical protein
VNQAITGSPLCTPVRKKHAIPGPVRNFTTDERYGRSSGGKNRPHSRAGQYTRFFGSMYSTSSVRVYSCTGR